jgi:hypothetical protein
MTPTERRIRARPKLYALVRKVAEARFVTVAEVCSRSRSAPIVAARHECWLHMRDQDWSDVAIGELWGVHRATVAAGLKGWSDG